MIYNINDAHYHLVYCNRSWFLLPLPFFPKEKIGNDGDLHSFKFTPDDGQILPEPLYERCCEFAYKKIGSQIKSIILLDRLPDLELRKLCTKFGIPIWWVKNQCELMTPKKGIRNERVTRREKRKCIPLTKDEYTIFIAELKKVNHQCCVLVEILWFINNSISEKDEYVTLEELLRLCVNDVDSESAPTRLIQLNRFTNQIRCTLGHYLPKKIWDMLCELIRPESLFVFSNKMGGPLNSGDVIGHLRNAGKRAGIKRTIGSLSFRPVIQSKHSIQQDVSEQEWSTILCRVPALTNRRGCVPKYDRRCIFNAILYHMRTGYPFRDTPSTFAPWKAIHSQYRRWKKSGILNQIFDARF